jgi:hypothetical protein
MIEDNYSLEGLNVEGNLPTVMENLKVFDHCLKPEGNIIFYRKLLSPLTSAPLKKEWREMIENIDNLTP